MSERDRMRFLGRAVQRDPRPPIVDSADLVASSSSGVATMRLYDPIDSFGGEWGISAKEFQAALDGLPESVNEIRLHINSPGGEVFEGIAITNALRNHRARVVAVVDGVAASAASFIASAADELVMGRNTELMIHDAQGIAIGDSRTMTDLAKRLDQLSDNIASIYAEKAGGTVEDWRDAMRAESWYAADEAVEAGLADRVDTSTKDKAAATNRYDLSIFNYAGRTKAPSPPNPRNQTPAASACGETKQDGRGVAVDFTDEQLTQLRERVGFHEGADATTVVNALLEALNEQAAEEPPQPTTQPATPPTASASTFTPNPSTGTMEIDREAWDTQQERIRLLEQRAAKAERDERDQVIAQAVQDGKFPPSRKEHWARLWDADPEGTREQLNRLAKYVVPLNELGSGEHDDESIDAEFAHLFPPSRGR